MNLMGVKFKQEHTSVFWEPFATSTPLKAFSNNIRVNKTDKTVHKSADSFHIVLNKGCNARNVLQNRQPTESKCVGTKRGLKTKSTFYFDATSSSDEDDSKENNQRPVIKINLANGVRAKSLLENEKSEEGDELSKLIGNSGKSNKGKDVKNESAKSPDKKNTSTKTKIKNKSSQAKSNCVKRAQNGTDNVTNEKEKVETNRNLRKRNENGNNLNADDLKSQMDLNESERNLYIKSIRVNQTKLPNKISNKITEPLVTQTELNDSEHPALASESDSQSSGSSKVNQLKRKNSKITLASPVKKVRKKKTNETEKAQPSLKASKNKKATPHLWDKGKNSSHQLFSDSVEQELINTLDLTEGDHSKEAKHINPVTQTQKISLSISKPSAISVQAKLRGGSCEQNKRERPSRRRQAPKEFWVPGNETKPQRIDEKLNKPEESPKAEMNNSIKNSGRNTAENTEVRSKTVNRVEEENQRKKAKSESNVSEKSASDQITQSNCVEVNEETERKLMANDVIDDGKGENQNFGIIRKSPTNTKTSKTREKNKYRDLVSEQEEEKKTTPDVNPPDYPVFKELKKLSYAETGQPGSFTSECWSVGNFKCGVFTVSSKSLLSNRTMHKNSYFGGVLIKGSLKMKIGRKKLELKEGDMAFVPPLTDWEAVNLSESESVVYYWSGRFRT